MVSLHACVRRATGHVRTWRRNRIVGCRRQAISRLPLGNLRYITRTFASANRRCDRRTGTHPPSCQQLFCKSRRHACCKCHQPTPRRRRSSVLLQLGSRGRRGRYQTCPKVRWSWPTQSGEHARQLPRPYPRRARCYGSTSQARAVSADARRFPTCSVW